MARAAHKRAARPKKAKVMATRVRGGASYPCPECGSPTRVHETRAHRGKEIGVWRRRRCTRNSKHVVHTLECDCGLELRVQR